MSRYNSEIQKVWQSSPNCRCKTVDCSPNNHRLCALCKRKVFYGAHESILSQNNSRFAWKIQDGKAVHIECNRVKVKKK
ncbi:MAG: hypothetical protein ACRC42_02855 [Mycoplasma sp.]